MIILALILILAGSLGGATALWLQDAPLWQVALGYVGGGWAGLLGGLPVLLAVRGWRVYATRSGKPKKQSLEMQPRHAVLKRHEGGR